MKLSCAQSDLSSALALVGRAVSPNNTLPVLNNILLKADGKKLFLTATNLEIALHVALDAQVENEGALTVPAKTLASYISLLSNKEEVMLTVMNGTSLDIRSKGSKTQIKGIPHEEFPMVPKLEKPEVFTIPVKDLGQAIEQVVFAASTNISRPVLTGIYWQMSPGKIKLAATDSYRLGEVTLNLEHEVQEEIKFILPSKTAHELAKILISVEQEILEVKVGKGQIQFKIGGIELMSRLIEGNFPDYERILPGDSLGFAELDVEEFTLALKKVSVIVRESNNNVKLRLEPGKLMVFTDETQVGQGSAEIAVETQGQSLETSLNVQYLLDALSHIPAQKVHFGLNDGLSPVKVVPVQPSGFLHIIMPLKV